MRFTTRIVASVITMAFMGVPSVLALDAATQQHVDELRAQIAALEQQAQQYRNAIAGQKDKANTLSREITILQSQISQLQVQINATGKKIDLTNTEISQTQQNIDQANKDMAERRASIGRMILFLSQYDRQSLVASLLKYEDLSSFLGQFHDVARVQGELLAAIGDLEVSKENLESSKTDLERQQDELRQLNDEVSQQQQQLTGVKSQKNKVLKDTKGQEALYQKQLTDIEKKQAAFFKEAQQLEAQVIAGGLYIVHVTAAKVPPSGTKLFRKPEDDPRLTQGYGFTSYARRGAYGGLQHNGIDLASGYGALIKASAAGTIIAHGTNDGWGNWVAIQHPNDLVTIYGHMSRFENLPVGTPVTSGQVIGYEGNTGNVTGPHVHFSVYREFFTYINPKNGQLYFNYDKTLNPLNYL